MNSHLEDEESHKANMPYLLMKIPSRVKIAFKDISSRLVYIVNESTETLNKIGAHKPLLKKIVSHLSQNFWLILC